jgi:hypothetical protein
VIATDLKSPRETASQIAPPATAPQSEDQKRATWEQQAIKRSENHRL